MSSEEEDRRSRRIRLHRRRCGAPAGAASATSRSRRLPPIPMPARRWPRCFRISSCSICRNWCEWEKVDWTRLDAVFCGLPHGTTQEIIAAVLAANPEDQGPRHVGGFPAARHEHLCAMVRPRAPRAEAAKRGRLRPHRILSREDHRRAAGRLSRLLSDGGAAGACSARQGQADRRRRHRHRRQIRRHRRRAAA